MKPHPTPARLLQACKKPASVLRPMTILFFVLASGMKTQGSGIGWEETSQLLFTDATERFRDAIRADASPKNRLGLAIALLNAQPRTEQNVNESRAILQTIQTQSPNSDIGILATYLLARILQLHQAQPDPAGAAAAFAALHSAHPGHPVAEQAAVKFAMLELYELTPEEKLPQRFDELEKLGAALKTPDAIRDFKYLLANARTDTGIEPAKTLELLIAADLQGFRRPATQADVWVRISQWANAQGRTDVAEDYAGRFVKRFIRDNRKFTMERQLDSWRSRGQ